ncbi:plasminogen activator inhibitor 1 RNA-binding protein [Drosophila yakuba]|uniref:Uncharacterized protein, isoform A n=1 Tax=Drosophila yakuba TaxID=7245 RepID=B4NYS8_DROYA|nr:plasminogen activator inhibitor 1 RNA-binding protein [Drosophila yakuba]XP_015054153.1 plasminogen activator inhibitor 1 RNA-binding protein [Drosophila yakuba]EDW89779.1 uncharacterized protein Dyak_GE19416, isoform A [Drosophila yakuba]KRJ98697.1 uncharacterized protein Dyak_GE19416, isoform B [Drosophila yakuba]
MDSAGKNRYELLFMDDDVSDPLDNLVAPTAAAAAAAAGKKKQPSAAAAATKTTAKVANNNNKATAGSNTGGPNAKKPNQAEKENKPNNALNKADGKKFIPSADKQFNNNASNNKQQGAPRQGGGANRTREFGSGQGQGQGQGQGGQQQRSVNFRQQNGNAETREQRNNRRNVRENGGAPDGQQSRPYRGPGGGQGAGGDRPQRQNRNYDGQNRKREFDRQSGSDRTGVKSIDKRDGAGSHNWGSVKEAIDDVNKNESETNVTNAEGGPKAEDSGTEPQSEQAVAEEEAKELTLDEWKAQQGQRIKPTFNIRKAGEGEDTTQWKKMVVLTSNKKKENDSEEELEYDPALYPQRVGRQQRVLDIQFNFNDGRRGGPGGFGGRGGRGGPRPGGFGGGPRSEGGNRDGGNREGGRDNREGGNRGPRDGQQHNNEGGAPSAPNQRPPIDRRGPGNNQNNNQNSGPGQNKRFERQQNTAPKVNDERQFPTLA